MPSSRDLPNPGSEPMSLMSPALAGGFFTSGVTWKPLIQIIAPFFFKDEDLQVWRVQREREFIAIFIFN